MILFVGEYPPVTNLSPLRHLPLLHSSELKPSPGQSFSSPKPPLPSEHSLILDLWPIPHDTVQPLHSNHSPHPIYGGGIESVEVVVVVVVVLVVVVVVVVVVVDVPPAVVVNDVVRTVGTVVDDWLSVLVVLAVDVVTGIVLVVFGALFVVVKPLVVPSAAKVVVNNPVEPETVVILPSGITEVSFPVRTIGSVMTRVNAEAIPTPSNIFFHNSQLAIFSQQL